MSRDERDFTNVAPHRLVEVQRRIDVLDRYLRREIGTGEAMEQLQLARSTFFLLAKIWKETRRPDALIGSGRPRRTTKPLTREHILAATLAGSEMPTAAQQLIHDRAAALVSASGGEQVPPRILDPIIDEARRANAPLLTTRHAFLVTFCAIDMPVALGDDGTLAPVAAIVLDVRERPVLLGLALSIDPPSPATAAAAILDALTSFDEQTPDDPPSALVMGEGDDDWHSLAAALLSAGIDTDLEVGGPRSRRWREVSRILGRRPAGVKLKPDITGRRATERVARVPVGGSALGLEQAEDIVRGRLRLAFPGRRRAIVDDADVRWRLATALRRLVIAGGRSAAAAAEQSATLGP